MKDNNNIIPLVTYNNMDINKSSVILNNKRKCGIYRITSLTNSKFYIGSSNNLSAWFRTCFNIDQLIRSNMYIYKAILKYGYSNFTLEIFEYCEPNLLIYREQYYIDLLKPEYNILKIVGFTFGYKHTIDTKLKMSILRTGERNNMYNKKHTKQTREAISLALKGKSRIEHSHTHTAITRAKIGQAHIGKVLSKETKLKLSLVTIGISLKVFDIKNNFKEFPSINSAAKYLNANGSTINTVIKKGKSYKNLIFKSQILDNRIWVYDLNYQLVKVLNNASKVSESFNIPTTTLFRYIESGKL